jgi:SNF2 family DNA or RNA helicase
VYVKRFISRGTIEGRIAELLELKMTLSHEEASPAWPVGRSTWIG